MEKQPYLSGFTLLEHLPRLFNMMHIVNMIIFGIVVSQPVFFLIGISSLHKSIRVSARKFFRKLKTKLFVSRKMLNYVIPAVIVLLFAILDRSAENVLLLTVLFALLILINRLLTIRKTDLPASQLMTHHWR